MTTTDAPQTPRHYTVILAVLVAIAVLVAGVRWAVTRAHHKDPSAEACELVRSIDTFDTSADNWVPILTFASSHQDDLAWHQRIAMISVALSEDRTELAAQLRSETLAAHC